MRGAIVAIAACAGLAGWDRAQGELIVLYGRGDTRSVEMLGHVLRKSPAVGRVRIVPGERLNGDASGPYRFLPVRSPGLSPGREPPRALPAGTALTGPFFLVGSDRMSAAWLARRREALQALGAVGVLVEADSVADLQRIAQAAGPVPVMPVSGTDIARLLGIRHYPVLVSVRGIEP